MEATVQTTRILGIDFYNDALDRALEIARNEGGLFLAPSGPGLSELGKNPHYDAAVQSADINLVDSGYLALIWKRRTGQSIQRHSGLKFIKALIDSPAFKQNNRQLWVVPPLAGSYGRIFPKVAADIPPKVTTKARRPHLHGSSAGSSSSS